MIHKPKRFVKQICLTDPELIERFKNVVRIKGTGVKSLRYLLDLHDACETDKRDEIHKKHD